jgi:hypothetical protein
MTLEVQIARLSALLSAPNGHYACSMHGTSSSSEVSRHRITTIPLRFCCCDISASIQCIVGLRPNTRHSWSSCVTREEHAECVINIPCLTTDSHGLQSRMCHSQHSGAAHHAVQVLRLSCNLHLYNANPTGHSPCQCSVSSTRIIGCVSLYINNPRNRMDRVARACY